MDVEEAVALKVSPLVLGIVEQEAVFDDEESGASVRRKRAAVSQRSKLTLPQQFVQLVLDDFSQVTQPNWV